MRSRGPLGVPKHLRDAHAVASRMIGAGKGYEYPHAHGGYVDQQYLPDELKDRRYFEPIRGREAELDAHVRKERGSEKAPTRRER